MNEEKYIGGGGICTSEGVWLYRNYLIHQLLDIYIIIYYIYILDKELKVLFYWVEMYSTICINLNLK